MHTVFVLLVMFLSIWPSVSFSAVPVGTILSFGGPKAPDGYLLCDGRVRNIADHQALFDVIGIAYGGDGVNTFKVPDLRGRMPVGFVDNGADVAAGPITTAVTDDSLNPALGVFGGKLNASIIHK